MSDVPNELVFLRKWWWDPIDMEVFRRLEQDAQNTLLAISLETQSKMLRAQAAGLEEMSKALR